MNAILMASGYRSNKRRNNKTQPSNLEMSALSPPSYNCFTRLAFAAFLISLIFLFGISSNILFAFPNDSPLTRLTPIYTVEIVNEFPHDHDAFTQGLLYWGNDTLYESTGLYGESTVRRVALKTGKVDTKHKMDNSIFGEGLTLLGERLYQVTWQHKIGFIYDRNNLNNLTTFTHHMNDGWGLATDGKILFGSDGSSTLYQMDPYTMKVIQKQTIMYEGVEVRNLNELEFINGEVWANVFMESMIQAGETNFDVLNGIAWDSHMQRIFVTGKLWPKLFEIKLHPITSKDLSHVNIQQHCIQNFQFF